MAKKIESWEETYETLSILGEGGNAAVFRVKNKTTGVECALKSLYNKTQEKKARFIDEIQIINENLATIKGILPILEYSDSDFWYTMPIAKGIFTYIEEQKLNPKEIIVGVVQLAETLEELHKKGIAHRDIKPSNIYYYNNRFTFGDFGLVEFPEKENGFTKSDKGLGAIFTIAPEMKRDPKNSDGKKADVFSLSKTAWMLLTGNDRGFDGTYNFLDKSMSLRFDPRFRTIHLVELEEALSIATDNDPDSRPTMEELKCMFQNWLSAVDDFNVAQLSGWKFLNKFLFGNNTPESARWKNIDKIVTILNTIGTMPTYNHMLLSDKGGLDFSRAEIANENNCLYIYDTIGLCFVVKPKYLYYEGFEENYKWNYFMLELDELEPIYSESKDYTFEYLVEDYPAHYVTALDANYGVYDYDKGEKLPEGYKAVRRYMKGKFLIVLKNGPYNGITSTYDGRHGMCSNDLFRKYLEMTIKIVNELVNLGMNEEDILSLPDLNKNPFEVARPNGRKNVIEDEERQKAFIAQNYKQWDFNELFYDTGDVKNIRYYLQFNIEEGKDLFSVLKNEKEYLCENGRIKKLNNSQREKEVYYTFERERIKGLRDECNKFIRIKCKENNFNLPEYENFFSICLERYGSPQHLFSKEEIETLMKDADDRKNNMLVIDENGYPHIIQEITDGTLYPVRLESWDSRNGYVGKYSDLSTLNESYIQALQGWLFYLKNGKSIRMDYMHENMDEEQLINEIRSYY